MLGLTAATVVTGGALFSIFKAYREQAQTLKEQLATQMNPPAFLRSRVPTDYGLVQDISNQTTVLAEKAQAVGLLIKDRVQILQENSLTLISGERRKQMDALAGGRYEVKSDLEKRVDSALKIASLNAGVAMLSFLYPPVIWFALPTLLYSFIPMFEYTWRDIRKKKRVSAYVLDCIMVIVALASRYFAIMALTGWLNLLAVKIRYLNEHSTKNNLGNLFGEQPRSVWILMENEDESETEIEIPFEQLQVGATIVLNAGQIIPIDGIITKGFATIDQHKLTGESQPVECGVGDSVLASSVVLAGKIYIEVRKTGEETVAMQIGQILQKTAEYKDTTLSRAESIADRSVPITAGLFFLTLPLMGANSALAVLSNKFGNKMKDFGPASTLVSLNLACSQGILIKDGRSLDLLNEIDTVVFDKTGTLTSEQPTVGNIHCYQDVSEEDVLSYAAVAEQGQTHPVARAILQAAQERVLPRPNFEDAKYEVGYGIQVTLCPVLPPDQQSPSESGTGEPNHPTADMRIVRIGSRKFMEMESIVMSAEIDQVEKVCHEQGNSLVYIAFDENLVGAIELHATIRPEAKSVIDQLHQRNIDIYIISGDHEAPTKQLAHTLGIEQYFANTLPENKAQLVEELRAAGRSICFVGDGINDTIALKKANVSVSLSGATTAATDTAQIVLMDGTLNHLPKLFDIVKDFNKSMRTNFLLSTVPAAVSLSGIFLFHWGFATAVMISQSVQFLGLGNSLLPLFRNNK